MTKKELKEIRERFADLQGEMNSLYEDVAQIADAEDYEDDDQREEIEELHDTLETIINLI